MANKIAEENAKNMGRMAEQSMDNTTAMCVRVVKTCTMLAEDKMELDRYRAAAKKSEVSTCIGGES